jgi:hypothetical protein
MSETYIIRWEIEGETKIVADSREEAEAKFQRFGIKELAENGTLCADDPATAQEIEADRKKALEFFGIITEETVVKGADAVFLIDDRPETANG